MPLILEAWWLLFLFFFFFLFNTTLQLSHSFLGAHIAKATTPHHDVYLLIIIPKALTKGRASCLVTMDTTEAKARAAQEGKGRILCACCKWP